MRKGYATVPRILDGGTILVLGCGPSLAKADVELCRGRVDGIIAVNNSYLLAPDATALYAADGKWWRWHGGCVAAHVVNGVAYPAFTGRFKYCMSALPWKDILPIERGRETGLSLDPTKLALGNNGVYQAMNLAVLFGASRILLLGVDMQNGKRADGKGTSDHFFGHHPDNSGPAFAQCLERFPTLVAPLREAGVEVVNCSRRTALQTFPCVRLESALGIAEAVSA